MSIIDKFLPMLLESEEEGTVSPILRHERVTFVYIKHNNLYRILVVLTSHSVVVRSLLTQRCTMYNVIPYSR